MRNGRNGKNGLADELKADAVVYFKNGKEFIYKAGVKNGYYQNEKLIREACGIIYVGALKALDAYAITRGYDENELPQNINEYRQLVRKHSAHNGKLQDALEDAYSYAHVMGYYRGQTYVKAVKKGIDSARFIIEKLTGKRIG